MAGVLMRVIDARRISESVFFSSSVDDSSSHFFAKHGGERQRDDAPLKGAAVSGLFSSSITLFSPLNNTQQ